MGRERRVSVVVAAAVAEIVAIFLDFGGLRSRRE